MKKAFTMIEILTVIAIIIVLAGIGIPAYLSWQNRGRIAEATAVINNIEMAMEMYKTDMGYYPQPSGAADINSNGLVYQFLASSFTVSSNTFGPYMRFRGNRGTNNELLDPWRNAYNVYTSSRGSSDPVINTSTCYIISSGPDTNITTDDIDNYNL